METESQEQSRLARAKLTLSELELTSAHLDLSLSSYKISIGYSALSVLASLTQSDAMTTDRRALNPCSSARSDPPPLL